VHAAWEDKLAPSCEALHVIKRAVGILAIILPVYGLACCVDRLIAACQTL
jgi:hypothetical protein